MTLYEEIEQILINFPNTKKVFVWSGEPDISAPSGIEILTWDKYSTAAYDIDDNLLFISASVHRG
jgi:hypothetical protein